MNRFLIVVVLICSLVISGKSQINNLKPSVYAVVIGISNYQDSNIPDLKFCEDDAKAFASFLQTPSMGAVPQKNISLLVGSQAILSDILVELERKILLAGPEDLLIFFFSGHGINGSLSNSGFFLTYDTKWNREIGTALQMNVVSQMINACKAKVKTLYIDACHAGLFKSSLYKGNGVDDEEVKRIYYSLFTNAQSGNITFLSSGSKEKSIEYSEGSHGLFTYFLLEGLKGKADNYSPDVPGFKDSIVNVRELSIYLTNEIRKYSKGLQNAECDITTMGDFPMSVLGSKITNLDHQKYLFTKNFNKNQNNTLIKITPENEIQVPTEIKLTSNMTFSGFDCYGQITFVNKANSKIQLSNIEGNTLGSKGTYSVNSFIPINGSYTTPRLWVWTSQQSKSANDCYGQVYDYKFRFKWQEGLLSKENEIQVTVISGYNKTVYLDSFVLGINNSKINNQTFILQPEVKKANQQFFIPKFSKLNHKVDDLNSISIYEYDYKLKRLIVYLNGAKRYFMVGTKLVLRSLDMKDLELYYRGDDDVNYYFEVVDATPPKIKSYN